MRDEADPSSATWGPAIRREVEVLADGAVVVGHSVGGTHVVQALADQPLHQDLAAVVVIGAPFVGAGGWPAQGFAFPQDLGAKLSQGAQVHVVHGLDDEIVPPSHAELHVRAIAQQACTCCPGEVTNSAVT